MALKIKTALAVMMAVCLLFGAAACEDRAKTQQTDPGTAIAETREPDASVPGEEEVQESGLPITQESESSGAGRQAAESNVLIAYFSATGTTKGVAEKIAALTGAVLYEIVPAEPYSSEDLNYNDSQSRASLEMNDPGTRPEIASEAISLDGYTTLYLGYPIWFGDAPRIMHTFVERYDFEGITVIPFCTSGSSGVGGSADRLEEQAGSGTWVAGRRLRGDVSETDLQIWIDEIQ